MKMLIDVDSFTQTEIIALVERALWFKQNKNHQAVYPNYSNRVLLNVFYEDSTRTRLSFELAAKQLGMIVLNLDPKRSSENKGETVKDMLRTIEAMGVDVVVMRHFDEAIFEKIRASDLGSLDVINAGCGKLAHPTQALLDIMTMMEYRVVLSEAKIAVVGDILHSRVAGSLQRLCELLRVRELVFVGPTAWLPKEVAYGRLTDSLSDALLDADIVMALRVQRERFTHPEEIDFELYRANYALTEQALSIAKSTACIMHPGPINRGVELDDTIADGSKSLILNQVANGVFMRMAILEAFMAAK